MDKQAKNLDGCLEILTEFAIMARRSTDKLRPSSLTPWPTEDAYKTVVEQIRDQYLTDSVRAKDEWYGPFIFRLSEVLIEQLLVAYRMCHYGFYGHSYWLLSSSMREQASEYSEKMLSKVLRIAEQAIAMPVDLRGIAEGSLESS